MGHLMDEYGSTVVLIILLGALIVLLSGILEKFC